MLQIAQALGLTLRRVQQIVRELRASGALAVIKVGRRCSYSVTLDDTSEPILRP
jgi:predicted transcriptional regulator